MKASNNNWKIVMAAQTVETIMVLNKLWIPDVLIDIIKDYLYIDTSTVLRNFYKASINKSISSLMIDTSHLYDIYGRKRITHWSIGQHYRGGEVQLKNLICTTCGECSDSHMRADKCCAMEWDGEDGTLELFEDNEGKYEEEEEDYDW